MYIYLIKHSIINDEHHRDDVPHGVAGAAAKAEKVLCHIFAN